MHVLQHACGAGKLCVCSELKNAMNGRMLTELGELEQNLVYGDMGSAELIKFLQGEYEAVSLSWYAWELLLVD
jgi:hypothetical protein